METIRGDAGRAATNMSHVHPKNRSSTTDQGLSIHNLLAIQATRTPDAIAIAAPGRTPLTYSRLCVHIDHVVKTINAMGLGRNDRVAIVLPNGPEMAVAFLAVAAAATSAPLNPAYLADEFDFYLSDLGTKALMIQAGVDSPARVVARRRGIAIIECAPALDAEAGIFTLDSEERSRPSGEHIQTVLSGFTGPDDVALVLHTSGTTSRPKLVPLTHRNLCTSAYNIQVALELTERDRCLNVMPLFHIHGLIGATLSSLTAGASVVCTTGFGVTTFFQWLEAFRPTWYTAVPTMHHAVLTRAESNREIIERNPLRFIRSSSAPLPPQVMAALESVFQTPVIESYGMTEASHQMASNPLPPRARKPGSVGMAAGPEIGVMDDIGNSLPWGEQGEIVIRGANVTQGYENNSTANSSALINGWFRTGDQGFLDDEGYLFITGRLKEIINRGGEKISPRQVDEVLMDHPAIAQAVTFAAPHISLGEEVAAAVVLRENASVTEKDIQEFARTRLADFKIPRRVIIVSEIPKGPTGKLQRIGLAEKLGLTTPDPASPVPPSAFQAPKDALEVQLLHVWERVLARKPIGVKDNFFDLGGDSLLAVSLLEEIERETGKNLPLATLFQALTVEQLADVLRRDEWSRLWSPLVAIQANGSKPVFFFIHAINGNVLNYRYLSSYLGPDQPFYGLQARGLDGKQAPHTRIEEMAALYINEIRTLQPEGPYFLGGGSSGGVIAFEMAQQLHALDQKVALLALFDAYCGDNRRPPASPAVLRARAYNFIQKADRHLGSLLLLKPKDQLRYIFELLGPLKTAIGEKLKKITYKGDTRSEGSSSRALQFVFEANRQALSNYVPQAYPGRITLFLSREAPDRSFYDRRLAWNEMAADGLEVHVVPGSHETLFGEPHVRVLAERLRVCLHRAQATLS